MAEPNHVFYVAVARFTDHTIIASHGPSRLVDDQPVRAMIQSPNVYVTPRQRYSSEGDLYTIHFVSDERKRVYCVVTDRDYPSRVAFTLLEEMQSRFLDKAKEKSMTATEGSLSRTVKSIFVDLCTRYDDLKNVDKLASIQDKVEVTKTIMSENIHQMLQNTEKLEDIHDKADHLGDQARLFKKQGKELKRAMWWKACKMRLLIAFLVMVILCAIIVPTVIYFQDSSSKGSSQQETAAATESNDNNENNRFLSTVITMQ
mmetsp:Transcript_11341/g.14739  ORF Transcript_11341/g.14739 Transcript_11341/m.14739 type:complete len:259 (+) Transcript_11341:143-919(+)